MKVLTICLLLLFPCLGIFAQKSIDGMETPFSRYEVNTDSCIQIEHSSGSLIFIEAQGIISDKRQVAILYREHIFPVDMLIHDIQMQVRLGEKIIQLESSGMFELYALDGSDTLDFDQNKQMEVRLNSPVAPRPGTEGYRYDKQHDFWRSYSSRIGKKQITDDTGLWGSGSISQDVAVEANGDWGGGFAADEDIVQKRIFQTFQISEFGMYNYDRMIAGLDYIYLKPNFSIDQEQVQTTIYIVYDNINSVFYFPKNTWQEEFFLIDDQNFEMFTITSEGEVAKLESMPDVRSLAGTSHPFELRLADKIPQNKQELAQITGIQ